MNKVDVGSIYKLPNSYAHVVVIYVYKAHKELTLCALFPSKPEFWDAENVLALIHSFYQPMDEGIWEKVGSFEIPEVISLTVRSSAGYLYIGDDKICEMPSGYTRKIPNLMMPYYEAFENASSEIVNKKITTKASLKIIRESEELLSGRAYKTAQEIIKKLEL